jgi:hypothetical protein
MWVQLLANSVPDDARSMKIAAAGKITVASGRNEGGYSRNYHGMCQIWRLRDA